MRRLGKLAAFVTISLSLSARLSAAEPTPLEREITAARMIELAVAARGDATARDREEVAKTWRDLAAKYPNAPAAHDACGDFLWNAGCNDEAVEHWRTAQRLDPRDAASANFLGGAFLRRGKVRDAAEQFSHAAEFDSLNASYRFNLANVEFMLRRDLVKAWQVDEAEILRRALAHFHDASRLAPANLEYARAYAETFYGLPSPDWNEALAAWQHVLSLSTQPDFARLQLARVSLKLRRKSDAIEFLQQLPDSTGGTLKQKLLKQAAEL